MYRSLHPDEWQWGLPEMLAAAAVDALNVANWQRGEGKKKDRPRPIPRPGVGPDKTTYGGRGDALSIEEFDDWLASKAA